MKGKKILLALAVFLCITVPVTVFAATSTSSTAIAIRGFFGIDTSKLTDQQKTNITDYSKKMADLQKEFINSMVSNGTITKEQGDARTKAIDDGVKNGTFSPESMGERGGRHGGFDGGFGPFGIDTSKLTDAQKTDLKATNTKIADLQKDLIKKEASDGLITKTQGDSMTTRVDNSLNDDVLPGGMGRGGFDGLNLHGIDTSKLTEAQKTYFNDYSKKFTELQKELINKYVSFGLMTKAQGDSMIQRIDGMGNDLLNNGMNFGFGKNRRGFMGRGDHNGNDMGNSPSGAM